MRKQLSSLSREVEKIRGANHNIETDIHTLNDVTSDIQRLGRQFEHNFRKLMVDLQEETRELERLTQEKRQINEERRKTTLYNQALSYENLPRNGSFNKNEWEMFLSSLPAEFQNVTGVGFDAWSEERTMEGPGGAEVQIRGVSYAATRTAIAHLLSESKTNTRKPPLQRRTSSQPRNRNR